MTLSTELHDGMKIDSSHCESASSPEDALRSGHNIIDAERDMSVWENARRHWRPMLVASVGVSSAMVFGYDTIVNGSSISMPAFIIYFGSIGPTGAYLPSIWTSLWTAMSSLMQAIGAIANGWVTDRLGRKWPACGFASLTLIGTALQYISKNAATLMGGKMVTGVGVGALMAVATTYIGEVVPLKLRAPLQGGLVIFIIFMQGCALGVVRALVPNVEESAFRTAFAIQWGVGGVAILAWAAVPESPAWLINKGKFDAARKVMKQIYGSNNSPDERYEHLRRTIEDEQHKEKSGTYVACFRGHNFKRTMTVAFLYSTSNVGGAPFLAQNIYFLIIAGLEAVHCFDIGIGGFGLAILLVVAGGGYLQRINRRTVVLIGLVLNLSFMLTIGGLYWAPGESGLWAIAVLMNVLISIQTAALQGAGWPIAAEIPSYHLRSKTLSIGIFAQTGTTWLFTFITPYMYNVDSGNLGAKTGFIYAGTTVLLLLGAWKLVPDTTGLSTAEIDAAYEAKVKPRSFHRHVLKPAVTPKTADSERVSVAT